MSSFIDRASHRLAQLFLGLSCACLCALMLLTVAEVIGRYGFNAPIHGRQDLAQILLAASIFLAFPVVTLRGEQIDVDLLDSFFSPRAAFWRDIVIALITSAGLLTMSSWLLHRADKALSRGATSEMLFIPKYPLIYAIAAIVFVSGALLAAHSIARVVCRIMHGPEQSQQVEPAEEGPQQ